MMLAVAWHISWQMVKEAAVPVTVSDGGLYASLRNALLKKQASTSHDRKKPS